MELNARAAAALLSIHLNVQPVKPKLLLVARQLLG